MDDLFFILLVIGYIFTLMMCLFGVYSISIHFASYGTKLMTFLNLITIIFTGFVYSTFFFFSITLYPSELLWKVTIIIGFLSLGNTGLIYAFLLEYKKIPILPFLGYTTFLGLIIYQLNRIKKN
jgi:hypothetical protein